MSGEKNLYGNIRFWDENQVQAHAASAKESQNKMEWPEADDCRLLAWIKGNAGAAGTFTVTLLGRLGDKWAVIDTLDVTAVGVTEVTGQKLINIKGFEELKGSVVYVDAVGKQVECQVFAGAPYK